MYGQIFCNWVLEMASVRLFGSCFEVSEGSWCTQCTVLIRSFLSEFHRVAALRTGTCGRPGTTSQEFNNRTDTFSEYFITGQLYLSH